jgi:hypothetical protein
MDTNIVLALIAMMGTALVAFITMLFSYLSKRLEHKLFVKQIRATRTFDAYELLIETLLRAEALGVIVINGSPHAFNHILISSNSFHEWHRVFLNAWYTKQYLLDQKSLANCASLQNFLGAVIYQYPKLMEESANQILTPQQLVDVSAKLLPLLVVSRGSLTQYLSNKLEEM